MGGNMTDIGWFIIGTLAGAIAGILIAYNTGIPGEVKESVEMIKELKKALVKTAEKIKLAMEDLKYVEEFLHNIDTTISKLKTIDEEISKLREEVTELDRDIRDMADELTNLTHILSRRIRYTINIKAVETEK
jgi:gas vesicle protein